jgi:hypothetical protein
MRTCEDLEAVGGTAARRPRLPAPARWRCWPAAHAIGKKVVEEAAERMAAEHEDADRTAEEIAQLLYHAQVLMLAKGLDLKDVYRHL